MEVQEFNLPGIYIPINLIRHYGPIISILLIVLTTFRHGLYKNADGYFLASENNLLEITGISPNLQRKAMKTLIADGIISVKRIGVPAKRWCKILKVEIEGGFL